MRILLVNPPDYNSIRFPGDKIIQKNMHMFPPPIGLMYIKGYLKKKFNEDVQLYNFQTPERPSISDFINFLSEYRPDVVGVTVMSVFWYDVCQINNLIKKALPSSVLIGGGKHMWLYPFESIKYGKFDAIVQGDGEKIFAEMLLRIKSGYDLSGMNGVIFKNDKGEIVIGKPPEHIYDINTLPFPDYSDISIEQYYLATNNYLPTAVLLSSRGCKYKCTFCFNSESFLRTRTAVNVIDEIIERKKAGFKHIYFLDDDITGSRTHIISLCRGLLDKQIDIEWSCNARVNEIDAHLIHLMSAAGCKRISFGIESGSQRILKTLNKGISLEQCYNAVSLAKKAGIITVGLFMVGLPDESVQEAESTIKFAIKLNTDYALCNPFAPAPGSKIYNDACRLPGFCGDYLCEFIKKPTQYFTLKTCSEKLTEDEIIKLQRKFYLNFYFRFGKIMHLVLNISNLKDLFKKATLALTFFLSNR